MDMEFTHETTPEQDDALIEAIGRARGKVIVLEPAKSRP